jgi:N-methylhydantoinase B
MRRGIAAAVPDGVYYGETNVDAFDAPLHIKVRVESRNGEVDIDFEGTSPQVNYGINCTPVYTDVWAAYTMKCIAAPEIPNNDGTFAPIRVKAPLGSFLNPRFPAPVRMKPASGHFIPEAIFDALKDVIPENIMAESGNKTLVDFSGHDAHGRLFHDVMFVMGGMGARATKDGLHTRSFPANSSNLPVEVLETTIPVRVRSKVLRTDSGGPGRYRGGCGQTMEIESVAAQPLNVLPNHGKLVTPPEGYRGGYAGAAGGNSLNGTPIPDKKPVVMHEGDVLRLEIPGSGGMYPPRERDPEAVRRDVEDEVVSRESAERDYAVVLDATTLAVDVHATALRRGRGAA